MFFFFNLNADDFQLYSQNRARNNNSTINFDRVGHNICVTNRYKRSRTARFEIIGRHRRFSLTSVINYQTNNSNKNFVKT